MDESRKQKMLAAVWKQRREIYRDSEEEFAFYLEAAKQAMPERAKESLFRFIVRRLWEPHDGDVPNGWLDRLPGLFTEYSERNAWALSGCQAEGAAAEGIQSMARLLCALRRRQRSLEGTVKNQ